MKDSIIALFTQVLDFLKSVTDNKFIAYVVDLVKSLFKAAEEQEEE